MLHSSSERAVAAELASIPGVADEDVEALSAFVALLPLDALVNANTAIPEVLGALLGVADAAQLEAFEDLRREHPFLDIDEFRAAAGQVFGPGAADRVPSRLLSFSSAWFEATAEVELGPVRKAARYILYRDTETGATSVVARVAEDL
jgi:general secretion pathway protein K